MKSAFLRKLAETKSSLVSKEAANNSTEVVIMFLFVVIIVIAVMTALMNGPIGQAYAAFENKVDDIVNSL